MNLLQETVEIISIDCGINVDNKKDLKKQNQALHQFTCKICDQLFDKSAVFEIHLRTHEAVNKFVCDLCEKSFYMKRRLRKHTLQHQLENVK